jgi:hypothetical protein
VAGISVDHTMFLLYSWPPSFVVLPGRRISYRFNLLYHVDILQECSNLNLM